MGDGMGMGSATKSVQSLEGLDWATAENKREGSKHYQKLDPSKDCRSRPQLWRIAGIGGGGSSRTIERETVMMQRAGADPGVSNTGQKHRLSQ
jgi:hypothetical protein